MEEMRENDLLIDEEVEMREETKGRDDMSTPKKEEPETTAPIEDTAKKTKP